MKRHLILALLVAAITAAQAQSDTVNLLPPSPVPEGHPGTQSIPDNVEQKEDRMRITANEIPAGVLKTLRDNDEYKGWENAEMYIERNTKHFIFHVTEDGSTRTYRFDESGLSLNAQTPSPTIKKSGR